MPLVEKIGYLSIFYWGLRLYREFFQRGYRVFFTPDTAMDLKKLGKWCIVAGCTQGIGRAYVEALAKLNLCIVLIDSASENLRSLANSIESNYNVKTKIIELDFSSNNNEYQKIEDEVFDLEIGLLVNNLGETYPYPEYFLNLQESEQIFNKIIWSNIIIFTHLCRILLPQMVERNRGVIVNVASAFAVVPSPLLTVFAASKAYVLKFSKDLAVEYEKDGIIVQCLCPGSVDSSPSESWLSPNPRQYVDSAIKTIGKDSITTGFYPHSLLFGLLRIIYRVSPVILIDWTLAMMDKNRRHAVRKFAG